MSAGVVDEVLEVQGAEWADQLGASGSQDGRTWRYLDAAGTCARCGQTIRVGACTVYAGSDTVHVRCVDWSADYCSTDGARSVRRAALTSTKLKGDGPQTQPTPGAAATALGKLDPARCPRFTVLPWTAEHTPGAIGTKSYRALLPLVDALPAYIARQEVTRASGSVVPAPAPKRVRVPKVAQTTPAPVCEPVATAHEVHEVPAPVPFAHWADLPVCDIVVSLAGREPAACTVVDGPIVQSADETACDLARALEDDPELYALPAHEVRAILWDRVAAGAIGIDDAMLLLERTYSAAGAR